MADDPDDTIASMMAEHDEGPRKRSVILWISQFLVAMAVFFAAFAAFLWWVLSQRVGW
jgi:flagellar basal body-associated protein FliL